MNIINASIAKKLKPLVSEAMGVISQMMENPAEFISQGYWTIPKDFEFSTESQTILDNLTVSEIGIFYAWIRNWLNVSGWGLAHPDCVEQFEGSQIFVLQFED